MSHSSSAAPVDPLRFHRAHQHLDTTFGDDTFALKAEAFARFFGTPKFLGAQTLLVILWIGANLSGLVTFDLYPFILLNLAFSLQSAYAAPLILLAQTRQAARDKAQNDADAAHREDLARASIEQQQIAVANGTRLLQLLEQNTALTETTRQLSARIEQLTIEMHGRFMSSSTAPASSSSSSG